MELTQPVGGAHVDGIEGVDERDGGSQAEERDMLRRLHSTGYEWRGQNEAPGDEQAQHGLHLEARALDGTGAGIVLGGELGHRLDGSLHHGVVHRRDGVVHHREGTVFRGADEAGEEHALEKSGDHEEGLGETDEKRATAGLDGTIRAGRLGVAFGHGGADYFVQVACASASMRSMHSPSCSPDRSMVAWTRASCAASRTDSR